MHLQHHHLLSGDLVNGKTAINERANTILTYGYSAVYTWDAATAFVLASSVRMKNSNNTNFAVDEPLPDTSILKQVRDFGYGSKQVAFALMTIQGIRFAVSARCALPNTAIGTIGLESEMTSYDGIKQCQVSGVSTLQFTKQLILQRVVIRAIRLLHVHAHSCCFA